MRTTILFLFIFKSVVDKLCEGTYGERMRVIPNWGYFPPPVLPSNPYRSAMDHVVDTTNDLGIAILKDHAYTRGNFAFSPYGVASVLVVLYEGARGESARQIRWAAGFPPDRDIIRIGFRDLHKRLKSYFSHEGYLSGITLNKQGSALKPEYKKILEFYGYDVDESDIQNEEEDDGIGEKDENPGNNSTSPTDYSTSSTANSITENAFNSVEVKESSSSTITTDNPEIVNTTEENMKDVTTSAADQTTQLDVKTPTDEKNDKEAASTATTEGFSIKETAQKFFNNLTTTEMVDFNTTTGKDITSPYDENMENKETSSLGLDPETTTNFFTTVQPSVTEHEQHKEEDVEKTTSKAPQSNISTESETADEKTTETSSVNLIPETTTSFSLNLTTKTPSFVEQQQNENELEDFEKTKTTTVIPGLNEEAENPTKKNTKIPSDVLTTSFLLNMTTTPFSVAKEPQKKEKPEEVEKTTLLTTTTLSSTEVEETAGEKTSFSNLNPETTLSLLSTTPLQLSFAKETVKEDKFVDIEKTTPITTQQFNANTEQTTEGNTITSTIDINSETTMFSSSMLTKPISVTEKPQIQGKPENVSDTTAITLNTTEKYIEDSEILSTGTAPTFFEPTKQLENLENNNITDSTAVNSTVSIALEQRSTSTMSTTVKDQNKENGNHTLLLSLDYGEGDEDEESEDGEEQLVPSLEFDIEETEKKIKNQNKRNPRFLWSFSEERKIKETEDKNEAGKPQAFKYLFPIRKRSLKMEDNSKKKGILICKECLLGNEEKRKKHEVISGGRKKRISELELNLQLQNGMHESRNYDLYRISLRPFLVDGLTQVLVPFMTYTNIFPYAYIPALNSKALEFPLDDIRYKLLILYPMERRGLKRLIYDLYYVPLREVVETLRPFRVKVTVPTFMVEGSVTLTPSLKNMGIRDVFDPRKSDLSGMSLDPELYVTNVEQSIKVVIRNYVEYLNMPTRAFGRRTREFEFQIWHPFLYFVLDSATNVALMAGQVLDPLNSRVY